MSNAKKKLIKLIEEMPEKEVVEVIDFVGYLRLKREKELIKEIERASESSLGFWDNPIDDEAWNNV
ncbi:MAG: DUF2281 domain-containing protein [Clostridia bacterium]|jgi:hypothetical protein|nr:DUF2281 domain-containing protein [Clostridia bacterium]